jgi:NAD(P)-dependent dehydrogenase (short-subunit alcohol dehydrogenase family)
MDVFIAGGNGAIGQALIDQYRRWAQAVEQPLRIYATFHRQCPSPEADVEWLQVDLRDSGSISETADYLQRHISSLDHWHCCSGYLHGDDGAPEKALKSMQQTKLLGDFAVNSIGPLLLFQACAPMLKRAEHAKAVFVSAQVGSIEDNRSGGWYGYRMSKAALNMGIRCAAIECMRWRKPPVVVAVHPGTTQSALSDPFVANRQPPPQTAKACGEKLFALTQSLQTEKNGTFLRLDGSTIPW